ncbi:MAG: chromosome segregation SMC family protein [Candidatus Pacearchaeota archaeon]
MTHIKKIVMQGFKSFAKKTEVIFDPGINVIVGPNGSGKSNVSDALCFALGRISAKSIRAEKTANLLFSGTKIIKPAKEAYVQIVFDNSNKTFNIPTEEVSIERSVKSNGQGTYKINNEVKTRGDIIEMLANSGIDPHGFNLVLQGQIQAIVKMHPEDRRKVIEEVSGIGVYEIRKEKSLHELEKTDERLKEINTVLREKKIFLSNLETERSQALRHKDLEQTIERCKFSILTRKITDKEKEVDSASKAIEEKTKQRDKIRLKIDEHQKKLESLNENISALNNNIKRSSGVEREALQEKISELKGEIAGLQARIESGEHRKNEFTRRIEHLKNSIPEVKKEIESLRKESPILAKKQEELKKKKEELTKLEEEKNKILSVKTELYSIKERLKEKESRHHRLEVDTDSLLKQVEQFSKEFTLPDEQSCLSMISSIDKETEQLQKEIALLSSKEFEYMKLIAGSESTIKAADRVKEQISKIDVCPLCQNKMTEEHLSHVTTDSNNKILESKKIIEESSNGVNEIKKKRGEVASKIQTLSQKINKLKFEYTNQKIAKEKQNYLKTLLAETEIVAKELNELKQKREVLENKTMDVASITEQYNSKLREIEEISSRTIDNANAILPIKERELEQTVQNISQGNKELQELTNDIKDMRERLDEKSSFLEVKDREEKELSIKFKKLFEERDRMQQSVQESMYESQLQQSELNQIADQINYLKTGFAQLSAQRESMEMERNSLQTVEPIKATIEVLTEKLEKARLDIQKIGAINMRALEVYEAVKVEYDKIVEKVSTLQKEKEEILKIVAEIDQKKKKTFIKTFKGINEIFSRNVSELYTKGKAYLKIENEEDMFAGGVDIAIQLGKGKYFDISSLSGGEQTLIALSLLFAIQEFKPYHFYVFDEIDAALDKRNSERLAGLLNKYIRAGQYIIVTHNDALIMNSKFIYGVSMHDGVSKVLSLKLDNAPELKRDANSEVNPQTSTEN